MTPSKRSTLISRRRVLGGIVAGAASLAGCSAAAGDKPYTRKFVEDNFTVTEKTGSDAIVVRDVSTGKWGPKTAIEFKIEVLQPDTVDYVAHFTPDGDEVVGEAVKGQHFVAPSTVYIKEGMYEFVAYKHTNPEQSESTGDIVGHASVTLKRKD